MKRVLGTLALCLIATSGLAATLTPGEPIAVRILYDNSGSMYPGYQPPGAAERHSRAELGARYFHQAPEFASWLADFVRAQSAIDARTVGMWTFTSDQSFTPADLKEVHPDAPVARFDVAAAIRSFPPRPGNNTFLTESLDAFARDFTGVIWLITDNIVETGAGEPDAGVQRFFQSLAQRPDLRSVHLFKYAFNDDGHTAGLAVYGVLVSTAELPHETLTYFDSRFRTLLATKRREGNPPADLYAGREYLKLKDLRIGPIKPELKLVLDDGDKGMFKEGQSVQLRVEGAIHSLLTQHSVTGGHYTLAISSPFAPEDWAQRKLGAQSLEPQAFDSMSGEITEPIAPLASRDVRERLHSAQPVSFTPSGPVEWLRLAWNGAAVRYTATARMSFSDVQVRLEPQKMSGIFGIDHASSVFEFQNVTTLPDVAPATVPVSFVLQTGTKRTAVLLVILIILAVLIALVALLLSQRRRFRIVISGVPERVTALRRLGRFDVVLEGKILGRLWRGLVTGYGFDPVRGDAALTVVPSTDGSWDVRFTGGGSHRLTINAEGGGMVKPAVAKPVGRIVPPPPPRSKSAPPPPPRSVRR
jgi:hypothetical protein